MRAWIADRARPLSVLVAVAVLAAAVVVGVFVVGNTKMKYVTVYFPSTIGIYKGTSVRLIGVPIGTVDSIKPMGTTVRVGVSYKASVALPADVGMAQMTPSIVSDRYLQFDATYSSGPELADHATIQADKTEVPVELDQIFGSINDLDVALGPNGANKDGALSQLINVGAANLKGNGAQFNATLKGFSAAIDTLSNSRDALFGTITSLQKFTTTLADDDAGVRTINGQLSQVTAQLAGERTDLGAALANLATALTQVQSFVADNKDTLTHDISGLTSVTSGLVSESQAIKEILDEAPDALYNLVLSFNRNVETCGTTKAGASTCSYGALVTRADNTSDPTNLVCSILTGAIAAAGTTASGLTNSACSTLLSAASSASGSAAPKTPSSTSAKAKAPTPVAVPSSPVGGLVGGLLGGVGKVLGGSSGGSGSSGSSGGSGGSSGSGSGSGSCTGLLCSILGGGAQ